MSLSDAVMRDLITVYLSGEASTETRALVEQYVAEHPEMKETLKWARGYKLPPVPAPQDLERVALEVTRRSLSQKNFLIAIAFFFTYIPLIFNFDGETVTFLMFRDQPVVAGLSLSLAAGAWLMFLVVCRHLRAAGLQPVRGWKSAFLWGLGGIVATVPFTFILSYWTGWKWMRILSTMMPVLGPSIGRTLGQVPPAELGRPTTLFGSEEKT